MENNRRSNTVKRIVESGMDEFLQKGYAKASLRAICNHAKVTTGAFYFSFESKAELFKAIVEPVIQRYEIIFSELKAREQRITESGAELDQILMRFLLEHRREVLIILEKSEGSSYVAYRNKVEAIMTESFREYFQNQLGYLPDQNLINVLVKQRMEGCMSILRGNYDMEYSLKLVKQIGVYATGGAYALISNLLVEVHQ